MDNAPITVVITTYNDSEYLSTAIDSVISQTLLPTQLLIIDDGSEKNDAYEIVERYIGRESRININYFRKMNGGASSARNLGINKSLCPLITFLDADDKMLPNNLRCKFDSIEKLDNSYFGVYGSATTTEKGKDCFANIDGLATTIQVGKPIDGIPGGSCSYLFRCKALKEIGGFDENLYNNEDYDLLIRLIKNNKKCKGIDSCGISITIRKNSLSRGGDAKKRFDNVMAFIDKAEAEQYFDQEEIKFRRKSVYLGFMKTIFFKNPIESLNYADIAFDYGAPTGFKQKTIYFLAKLRKLNK